MRILKALFVLAASLFLLFVVFGIFFAKPPSEADRAKAKEECVRAVMSNIDHPVRTYADKVAYDAVVREKCAGMSMNGKPIAP